MCEFPGKNIKKMATILCILAFIAVAVLAVNTMIVSSIFGGIIILLVGGFIAYFFNLLLYAYGELVDNIISISLRK